jgi:hypothetical protein
MTLHKNINIITFKINFLDESTNKFCHDLINYSVHGFYFFNYTLICEMID